MIGAIDANFGLNIQHQMQNIWRDWIEDTGENIFGIKGANVFVKMVEWKKYYLENIDKKKMDKGVRNIKFPFPKPDPRHQAFPISEWYDSLFDTVMYELKFVEKVPEGTPISACPRGDVCPCHAVDEETKKDLADTFPWHTQFQADKKQYQGKDVEHYICGAFSFTEHHQQRSKCPRRDVYICPSKTTMQRHLFIQSPHAVDQLYCKALVLSIILYIP